MSKITKSQVEKLASLSRLQLSETELEVYAKELESILEYVERLEKVETSGLKPSYQVTGLSSVMREDEEWDYTAKPDDLLSIVPRRKDRYIKVNRMI